MIKGAWEQEKKPGYIQKLGIHSITDKFLSDYGWFNLPTA